MGLQTTTTFINIVSTSEAYIILYCTVRDHQVFQSYSGIKHEHGYILGIFLIAHLLLIKYCFILYSRGFLAVRTPRTPLVRFMLLP